MDEALFRQVMSHFASGVTVVTTRLGDTLRGLTVNAFCSLSLEPMLVLVCIDQVAQSRHLISGSGIFAVNILSWRQQFLADRFAGRALPVDDAFSDVPYNTAATGAPIVDGSLAWLDCRVVQSLPAGDHVIFVGEVEAAGLDESQEPLLYYQSRFSRLRG